MGNTEELWLEGGGMREVYTDDYVDSLLIEINRLQEKLRAAEEAITFATKPPCMCWAGCADCQPDPMPPTLEEALAKIRGE